MCTVCVCVCEEVITPPNSMFTQKMFSSGENLITAVMLFSPVETLIGGLNPPPDDKGVSHLVLEIKSKPLGYI